MEQFFCMLQLKRNILVRPSLWEDPFEELIKKTKVALSLEGKNEKLEVALNWQNCIVNVGVHKRKVMRCGDYSQKMVWYAVLK